MTDRKQHVVIHGSTSTWVPVTSGVPQGSVLGPLLFLIYINDIVVNIQSTIRLFADDCVLYREIRDINDCKILQSDLNKLYTWQHKWQMKFNAKKCNIMHVTRKKTPHKYLYKLNNEVLNVVSKYPYLGVEIQDDLNWHTHIQKICSKANKVLGLLKRNISSCSPATKSLAYLSLVRPCVEYASSVWDPFLQKHINELEQIQRRSGRFVYSDYRRSSSA